MSKATNKKLSDELNYIHNKESVLSILVFFGMKVEIMEDLYDFEIIILGKKKRKNEIADTLPTF